MKLKSISGVAYYVKDLAKTAEFYEALGFRFGKQENGALTVYVNWFWIEFHATDSNQQTSSVTGTGPLVYVAVDSVDEYNQELITKGIKPLGEPTDSAMGRRELLVTDPDGYRLVFFQKA